MRIVVLNTHVPFVSGGAEILADALVARLQEHGHQAVLYRIPFRWMPPEKIVEGMLACRLIRLYDIDRVIGLKFPAYFVPHDNKVLWLLHQFRQAYDLWGTPLQDLPDTEAGRQVRHTVIAADNAYLAEARALYTISPVTAGRLKRFNGLDAEVLHTPLVAPDQFTCEEYGDYIFCPGRITRGKRQHLVVEAMRHTRTPVRLVVTGHADDADELRQLEAILESAGLADRVRIVPRFIPEAEKARLYAGALACAYVPVDEDSFGYVTMESYQSRKPVISCRDSGGVSILVKDGETGYLTDPEPVAIARAIDDLYLHKARAQALGEAGFRHMQSLDITWDRVVRALTS